MQTTIFMTVYTPYYISSGKKEMESVAVKTGQDIK
jgi:hypothetical protein